MGRAPGVRGPTSSLSEFRQARQGRCSRLRVLVARSRTRERGEPASTWIRCVPQSCSHRSRPPVSTRNATAANRRATPTIAPSLKRGSSARHGRRGWEPRSCTSFGGIATRSRTTSVAFRTGRSAGRRSSCRAANGRSSAGSRRGRPSIPCLHHGPRPRTGRSALPGGQDAHRASGGRPRARGRPRPRWSARSSPAPDLPLRAPQDRDVPGAVPRPRAQPVGDLADPSAPGHEPAARLPAVSPPASSGAAPGSAPDAPHRASGGREHQEQDEDDGCANDEGEAPALAQPAGGEVRDRCHRTAAERGRGAGRCRPANAAQRVGRGLAAETVRDDRERARRSFPAGPAVPHAITRASSNATCGAVETLNGIVRPTSSPFWACGMWETGRRGRVPSVEPPSGRTAAADS